MLRRIVVAIVLVGAPLAAQQLQPLPAPGDSIPADSVCAHARGFAGPCTSVHGRVRTRSDNVIAELTDLRTGHIYNVAFGRSAFLVMCTLPADVRDLLAHTKIIYADFVIRPLVRDRPGVMGHACIAAATHVTVRSGGLDHPLFRPRS
jgi:hypothetical protein